MTIELDKTRPLGQKLAGLPGLNLYTSKAGITGTCDSKHIFKHFGTLLRSPRGIIIFGDSVTAAHIHAQLCVLPGMTQEKASQQLDPADNKMCPKLSPSSYWLQHASERSQRPKSSSKKSGKIYRTRKPT